MSLGSAGGERGKLGVFWMALALVAASFLGASLGLVWQSSGLGEDEAEAAERD